MYIYKGAKRAAGTATTAPRGNHGTSAGWQAHYLRGDRGLDICTPCREARAADRRARLANKAKEPRPVFGCGTPAGYSAHKRAKTDVCTPCMDANRVYRNRLRRAAGETKGTVIPNNAVCQCGLNMVEQIA